MFDVGARCASDLGAHLALVLVTAARDHELLQRLLLGIRLELGIWVLEFLGPARAVWDSESLCRFRDIFLGKQDNVSIGNDITV